MKILIPLFLITMIISSNYDDLPNELKLSIMKQVTNKERVRLGALNKDNYKFILENNKKYKLRLPLPSKIKKSPSEYLCLQKKKVKALKVSVNQALPLNLNRFLTLSYLKCFSEIDFLEIKDQRNAFIRLFMDPLSSLKKYFPKLKYLKYILDSKKHGNWLQRVNLFERENSLDWIPNDLKFFSLCLPENYQNSFFYEKMSEKISLLTDLKKLTIKSDNFQFITDSVSILNQMPDFEYFKLDYNGKAETLQTLFPDYEEIQYAVDLKLYVRNTDDWPPLTHLLGRLPKTTFSLDAFFPEYNNEQFCQDIKRLTYLQVLKLKKNSSFGHNFHCLFESLSDGLNELEFGQLFYLIELPVFTLPPSLKKVSVEESMSTLAFNIFANNVEVLKTKSIEGMENIFSLHEPFEQLKTLEIVQTHHYQKFTTDQLKHLLQLLPQTMDRLYLCLAIEIDQDLGPALEIVRQKQIKQFQLKTFTEYVENDYYNGQYKVIYLDQVITKFFKNLIPF